MGKEWKQSPKEFSYIDDEIIVKIISLNKDQELLKKIKEYFPQFIFENNFGTRQSKGFGSFSVTKIDDELCNFQQEKYFNFTNMILEGYTVRI